MMSTLRQLDEAETVYVSGGYVTDPEIIVRGPYTVGGFNPGERYNPGFTGTTDEGGGAGFAVGAFSSLSLWGVVQWAVDHAIDYFTGESDKKAAAEKQISDQFDPKNVIIFGGDPNGVQFRVMSNGDVFTDSDKNGSYDTISRQGGDGHIYQNKGDGRGFVDTTAYWVK